MTGHIYGTNHSIKSMGASSSKDNLEYNLRQVMKRFPRITMHDLSKEYTKEFAIRVAKTTRTAQMIMSTFATFGYFDDLDKITIDGYPMMFVAIAYDNGDMVRVLYRRMNGNMITLAINGQTIKINMLSLASMCDAYKSASALLEEGIEQYDIGDEGKIAFFIAQSYEYNRVMKEIIDHSDMSHKLPAMSFDMKRRDNMHITVTENSTIIDNIMKNPYIYHTDVIKWVGDSMAKKRECDI